MLDLEKALGDKKNALQETEASYKEKLNGLNRLREKLKSGLQLHGKSDYQSSTNTSYLHRQGTLHFMNDV